MSVNERIDVTPTVIEGNGEGVNEDSNQTRKEQLIEEFKNDPLYPMVSDYDVISEDILELDPSKLYSTKDVANILSEYDYFYDPIKGESYINENRIRWWFNEKEPDNLIFYFNLEKPGRAWVWDLRAIIKAKIVAILRFVKNHQQKMIKVYATGLQANTPKISQDNIMDLVEAGNFDKVNSLEVLKEITLAAFQKIAYEFDELKQTQQELYGQVESYKEENDSLRKLIGNVVTKEEISSIEKSILEKRDMETTIQLKVSTELRIQAAVEWDKQNNGMLKRLRSKESDKQRFINEYVELHYDSLFKKYLSEYEELVNSKRNESNFNN